MLVEADCLLVALEHEKRHPGPVKTGKAGVHQHPAQPQTMIRG